MRDRVNPPIAPPVDRFDAFPSPVLSPAEGLDSSATLFTAPPFESLEILNELSDIAAESLRETVEAAPAPTVVAKETAAPVAPTPRAPEPPRPAPAAKSGESADARLMNALLEYHRLRGPKLGARTAPRPSGNAGSERFSAVEIPVVHDAIPKTSPAGIRASRPVQTILKPKPRP